MWCSCWDRSTTFHTRRETLDEFAATNLERVALYGVEGPAWIAPDFEARWADEEARAIILRAARAVESDPGLQILSPHLLAIARRPGTG